MESLQRGKEQEQHAYNGHPLKQNSSTVHAASYVRSSSRVLNWRQTGHTYASIRPFLKADGYTRTPACAPHFQETVKASNKRRKQSNSCSRAKVRRWSASALHPRDVRTTSLDTERVSEEDVHMSETSPSTFHIPLQIPLTVTLETAVRRTELWFQRWYPTTVSHRTLQNIAGMALSTNIRVEDLSLSTPPDGYCLFYSMMAAQYQDSWRYRRTALGFRLKRGRTTERRGKENEI